MTSTWSEPDDRSHGDTRSEGRCWLFAYGTLQPGYRLPASCRSFWHDRVRGELFALASFPAAVRVGQSGTWFAGHTLDVAESELELLDTYEGVGDELYRRIRTTTERGLLVWIYEFAQPLPDGALGPIERWLPDDWCGAAGHPSV